MPTDLTAAQDHPVRVVADWLDSLPAQHHERPGGYRAQEVLSAHEREHGVTFAALDNEVLAQVRQWYEAGPGSGDDLVAGEFARAVSALLGLD